MLIDGFQEAADSSEDMIPVWRTNGTLATNYLLISRAIGGLALKHSRCLQCTSGIS